MSLPGCGQVDGGTSAATASPAAPQEPAPRSADSEPARDLILITIDTLRSDALGFMGNEQVKTPVLDRLAAQGLVFDQARAHNTMTLPSHANILTGRLPFEHGIRDNAGFVLSEEFPTLATVLRDNGFATAAVIGAFPLDARFGLNRGFDHYDDSLKANQSLATMSERPGHEVVAPGLEWWQNHQEKRRFLWLHLFDPHAPYEPPGALASEYANNPYLGEVAAVDGFLAPILEPLLSQNQEERQVLVIVTSDHGEGLGEHGELTHGVFAYDSTLKVPLQIFGPGMRAGRSDLPVGHIDIMPTALRALGVAAPEGLSGQDLVGAAQATLTSRDHYFESLGPNLNRGWAPLRGVVHGGTKYIDLPVKEVYDLLDDPGEVTNLAPQTPAQDLAAHQARLPESSALTQGRGSISKEEQEQLAALGYLSDTPSLSGKEPYTERDDPKNLMHIDGLIHDFIEKQALGQLSEATKLAQRLVKEQPRMPTAHYNLATVLLQQGQTAQALSVLESAFQAGTTNELLVRQYALTLAEAGQAARALPILERATSTKDSQTADPDTLNALAVVAIEAGAFEQASRALGRVLERDPDNAEAFQNRALLHLQSGRFPQCAEAARQALALQDSLPLAWNYLGIALYNMNQKSEAIGAWQRAVQLDPSDYDLLFNLALVASELGQRATAIQSLRRFVAEAPPARYGQDIQRARMQLQRLQGSP